MMKENQEQQKYDRMKGLYELNVWNIMTPLTVKTRAINLGQGYPEWQPPQFYLKYLKQAVIDHNYQYTDCDGSPELLQSIAKYHQQQFKQLDPYSQIIVTNGAMEALNCCFKGLLDPGDQVIVFDPFFDFYKPQVQIADSVIRYVLLKPVKDQTTQQLKLRIQEQGIKYKEQLDSWQVDYQQLGKALNQRTRILLINSPQNPLGKIFSTKQLQKIGQILKKYPRVIALQDNVYDTMTFDNNLSLPVPKMSQIKDMKQRSINIFSGGKLFSATGVKIGWIIVPKGLYKKISMVHQYTIKCLNNFLQRTISKNLKHITTSEGEYNKEYAKKLMKNRNLLIEQLVNSKYSFRLWIPQAGYFVLVDVSECQIQQKYLYDQKGNKRTRDYAFSIQMIYEDGVSTIPCSTFFGPEHRKLGQNYVRFAFCKKQQSIIQAGKRIR